MTRHRLVPVGELVGPVLAELASATPADQAGGLTLASPSALRRFDGILHLLAARHRGRTMADLASAYTLAQELEADAPDPATLASLTARLGLRVADLDRLEAVA